MLLSLFLVSFWIQLISAWTYKAIAKYPIVPVRYRCPVPLNVHLKPVEIKFNYPDITNCNLLTVIQRNINIADHNFTEFSEVKSNFIPYSNIPDMAIRYENEYRAFHRYVEVPPTPDELHNYEFEYSTPFINDYFLQRSYLSNSEFKWDYFRVHAVLADRLPLVRTENYCTGWKFFSCFYLRENFWYEGELQYYFQEYFVKRVYVIIATDRVYFSWLQFMRKMQIRAGLVLRMSKIAHKPVPYILEAVKKLSCHWNQEKPNGENTIYYSLSMEMLLSQTDLNVAKNGPGFPYIIVAVPTRLSKASMTIARKFFMEETIAELIGFFSTVFEKSKLDVVFVNTDTQEHTSFEACDTQTKFDNLKNISSQLKQHFLATVKDTGNTHNIFNLKANIFTELIREKTKLHARSITTPIVITFSEIPNLFKNENDSFDDKKYVLPFIRELKQANAHALFINSETTHYQRKMPIKDTDVDVSVFPIHPHPLHLIYEMFLITRDHVVDRISQVMRVDKQQLTFDTDFTATFPVKDFSTYLIDIVALFPTKISSSDVALSKTYFTDRYLFDALQFFMRFLYPLQARIGQAVFNNYLEKEGLVDCNVSQDLLYYESAIPPHLNQDILVGDVPIKHLDFEKCLSNFSWFSSSYKVAIIFVDTLTKDWVDAASEATAAFATQSLKKEGMIIFVSSNIPAELQKHREKDVYTIDSAVCSDIKQCVLDRIFYSKLINGL